MKILKKTIFSVLLLAFVFVSFHDYVVTDVYSQTNPEISHHFCDDSDMDIVSHAHDSIHTLLVAPPLENIHIAYTTEYLKPFDTQPSLKSYIGLVPQRPPLT